MTGKQNNISRRGLLKGVGYFATGIAISQLASCASNEQAAETETSPTDSAPDIVGQADSTEPVKLGLVAALTGKSALSGEAITRGLSVAIEKVNEAGGVLGGRPLELIRRDDESNPAKGVAAARELIEQENAAVVFGGLDSPVSLAMLPVFHELETPYMGVWAAATGITRNDFDPNYAFRVSANDNIVDKFLLRYARETYNVSKVGLMLINNPWGESNQQGFEEWAGEYDLEITGIEKFNEEDTDVTAQLTRLKNSGAEALMLVANAAPAAQVMRSLTRINWDVPIVSHWGISGGRFPELAGDIAGKVEFVQTYSFFDTQSEVGQKVLNKLDEKFQLKDPSEILAPVGTANAYDALMLTKMAIDTAGTTEGAEIREALLNLPQYEGLIKTYDNPFTADNYDALTEDDYIMVRWEDNKIVPVEAKS
ncbi:Receptor family ligand binding region [Hyella patelloides LEGE 07179]|uniref:Receptor family ligand binding region n=1 Tax=Hyella patelloides LEGE 07179 TaxID=945734 RepID=A0A563VSU8_9CYAN|nr:ABC transporter substrate-binding protein [Hyella patelloides]VEP14520.1 Receptor family ligand binding region [Hyella patelloides LEGE 07179]